MPVDLPTPQRKVLRERGGPPERRPREVRGGPSNGSNPIHRARTEAQEHSGGPQGDNPRQSPTCLDLDFRSPGIAIGSPFGSQEPETT